MPDPNEAREEAWRTLGIPKGHIPGALVGGFKEVFDAGWDARGSYDEQRIAELEAALDTVRNELWRYLGGRSARAAAISRAFDASMRALGQSEEVKP